MDDYKALVLSLKFGQCSFIEIQTYPNEPGNCYSDWTIPPPGRSEVDVSDDGESGVATTEVFGFEKQRGLKMPATGLQEFLLPSKFY